MISSKPFRRVLPSLLLTALATCVPAGPASNVEMMSYRIIDGAYRTSIHRQIDLASPIFDAANNEIKLTCARNETVGFFLLIESGGIALHNLTLSADSLAGERLSLDVSSLKFFRVLYIKPNRAPGWHIKAVHPVDRYDRLPDILIPAEAPLGGQPYTIAAGQELLMWVDVVIPTSADPGQYYSTIRVLAGENTLAQIPLLLKILPFQLPDDVGVSLLGPVRLQALLGHHLQINGEPFAPDRVLRSGPLYEESSHLVRQTLLMLQQHRISPLLTGVYPIAKLNDLGDLLVEWDDYDELVGSFVDSRLYPNQPEVQHWLIPFDETFPSTPSYDALSSPKFARKLRQYFVECERHFKERGWFNRSFVLLPPARTQYTSRSFKTCRSYAEIARLASEDLRLATTLPPQDLRPYGWESYPYTDLTGQVGIWCPKAQFFDPMVLAQPQFRHTGKWFQLDRPPFSGTLDLTADETFVRVIPWQAARLGAEAVLLPTLNDWSDDFDWKTTLDQLPNSTPLILPGRLCGLDTPLPTLRLKMLRRGMQDLAYLHLCRQKGLHHTREIILRSLCRFAGADAYGAHFDDGRFDGWSKDPKWWNLALSLMVDELRAPAPSSLSQRQQRLDSIDWQRFLQGAARVRLRTDGVRVSLQPGPAGPPFRVDVLLTVENPTHQPITALVKFGALPMGWQSDLDRVFVEALEPYGSQAVLLRALADAIPADSLGQLRLPVTMELGEQAEITSEVQLSHITVRRLAKPIQLDGDLSDWPAGLGNVAGGFGSISPPARYGNPSPASQHAEQDVIGWVCADGEFVYFAFHCLTSGRLAGQDAQKNFITYDDRIPIGEELIEILIDPAGSGSSSPSDIYHLAIKPSGAILKERGIRCEPQVAEVLDWPADIRVATRVLDDRWVAEVRVPLDSLGPAAGRGQTWSVNFCRFNSARWSYTTWSGAERNAYNPLSFGNMSFP